MSLLGVFEMELDALDASIFTGDVLVDHNARMMLRAFMARWERAVVAEETNYLNEDFQA